MSREDPQLKLRLPTRIKERIENYATAHGRSLNAEIIAMLEEAMAQRDKMDALVSTMTGQEAMEILRGIRQMIGKNTSGQE